MYLAGANSALCIALAKMHMTLAVEQVRCLWRQLLECKLCTALTGVQLLNEFEREANQQLCVSIGKWSREAGCSAGGALATATCRHPLCPLLLHCCAGYPQ